MDYMRQISLLDPKQIKNKSITLVGAGATGSYIALTLAQLGWGNSPHEQGILKVFDGDVVEEHNLANQVYEESHIGKSKVEALKEIILRKCGFEIEVHNEFVTDQKAVQSTYVFLLTDTMASRKEIFDKCLKYSMNTDMIVETRMGLRDGRVYAFNPHNGEERDEWEKSLYSDEEATDSVCGASASIITTATFLASMACGRVIQHFNMNYGAGNEKINQQKIWNEAQFSLYPESFYYRMFGKEEEPQIIQQGL